MRALCLVCTLKRSPEPSNAGSLADVVLAALREHGVETETIRLTDRRIDPGVVSEAVEEGDEWPAVRERIVAADILVFATPTWLGQPSSVAKRALERMDAMLSETAEDGKTPIAYNRVAGVVVVGNEDGAHHVISQVTTALVDIGYTAPGSELDLLEQGPRPRRRGVAHHLRSRLVDLHGQDRGPESRRRRASPPGLPRPAATGLGRLGGPPPRDHHPRGEQGVGFLPCPRPPRPPSASSASARPPGASR